MKLEQLEVLARRLDGKFRAHCARLNRDDPWFARVTLSEDDRTAEYFVGREGFTPERILDWRHPTAVLFFEAAVGDDVTLSAPFVQATRRLDSRARAKAANRQIQSVDLELADGNFTLVATETGFVDKERAATARSVPSGLDDIVGQLTPAQYRLITANREAPLIIQGRAGSGKTSVGLYRLAWLTYAHDEGTVAPVNPGRILVVMFNKALQMFVSRAMEQMALNDVRIDTFHGWALSEVKRGYRGEIVQDTTRHPGFTNATLLKKRLGILKAVEAYVARQAAGVDAWLAATLPSYDPAGEWLARFRATTAPLARRAILMRSAALRERDQATAPADKARLTEIHRIFDHAVGRLTQYKEELFRILTDRKLLAEHLQSATPAEIDDLIQYQTALQVGDRADRKPGPQVAFEDLAILLRLMQLKHGGLPNKEKDDEVQVYEHVLIDEAQDFGAVELAVILASVRSRTGVTIVGDTNQKIVPEADFIGWDALARELGVSGAVVARLEVPHRSTAPIMRLADSLVGDVSADGRPGPMPRLSVVGTGELIERVAQRVRAQVRENPVAHVAVVCGSAKDVDATVAALAPLLAPQGVPVRVGRNNQFTFAPGVTVTNLRQIKGLEFDAVIALNVNEARYPNDEQGRRWLYTLVTRAKAALHLFSTEAPCSLLEPAIKAGLVALDDESEITPAALGSDEPF